LQFVLHNFQGDENVLNKAIKIKHSMAFLALHMCKGISGILFKADDKRKLEGEVLLVVIFKVKYCKVSRMF
jgi:hypothetical protein